MTGEVIRFEDRQSLKAEAIKVDKDSFVLAEHPNVERGQQVAIYETARSDFSTAKMLLSQRFGGYLPSFGFLRTVDQNNPETYCLNNQKFLLSWGIQPGVIHHYLKTHLHLCQSP